MNPKKIIVAFLLGFALAAGLWLSLQRGAGTVEPTTATVLPSRIDLPEFTLVNQNGERVQRDVFQGQWDIVFFGFTSCPDVCPLTLKVLADAQRTLADEGVSTVPRIVLVSVDPERDTPERLKAYIDGFRLAGIGLTGELDEIRKLTSALGIFFEKRPVEDGFYSVDHSSVVLVINPEGQFHSLFSSPHLADNFVNDLPRLMGT